MLPQPAGRFYGSRSIGVTREPACLGFVVLAAEAKRQYRHLQIVQLPPELAVGADCGLTVINKAPPAATQFAEFILSAPAQRILASFGFAAAKESR